MGCFRPLWLLRPQGSSTFQCSGWTTFTCSFTDLADRRVDQPAGACRGRLANRKRQHPEDQPRPRSSILGHPRAPFCKSVAPESHEQRSEHDGCSVESRSESLKVVDRFRHRATRPAAHNSVETPSLAVRLSHVESDRIAQVGLVQTTDSRRVSHRSECARPVFSRRSISSSSSSVRSESFFPSDRRT